MSTRSKAVGKRIARAAPANVQDVLDSQGGYELYALLAPHIVRTSAVGAAVMRAKNKDFRDAIDDAIRGWMVELNTRFQSAQMATARLSHTPKPDAKQQSGETVSEAKARYDAEQNDWTKAGHDIHEFRVFASRAFDDDVPQIVLKSLPMAWNDDTRNPLRAALHDIRAQKNPTVDSDGTAVQPVPTFHAYHIGFGGGRGPIHWYLAAAASIAVPCGMLKSCELHGMRGVPCEHKTLMALAPTCYHQNSQDYRLMWCGPQCVEEHCVRFNAMSGEPIASRRESKTLQKNNTMFRAMLRHKGVPDPFSATSIRACVGPAAYDKLSDKGPEDFTQSGTDVASIRSTRQLWLLKHPAVPEGDTLQHLINAPPHVVEMAREDIKREQVMREEIRVATQKARSRKLLGDFDALVAATNPGWVASVAEIDNLYPGTKRTIENVLGVYKETATAHPLDISFTNLLVDTVAMMIGPLRRYDQMFAPAPASGHAYVWFTGLWSGQENRAKLCDISSNLNTDPVALNYDPAQWRVCVTAMHAFDALKWDSFLLERYTPREAAGGSSDPLPDGYGSTVVRWSVRVGEGAHASTISGHVDLPTLRSEWLGMKVLVENWLDLAGLEVDKESPLPECPCQAIIRNVTNPHELSGSQGCSEARAAQTLNYVEILAQTMAHSPETRAVAIDLITGGSSRGFIQAVGEAHLDLDALQAEAACRMAECD